MRVLLINEVCGHTSTGKICAEQAQQLCDEGHEVKIAYGRDDFVPEKYQKFAIRIGNDLSVKVHGLATRLFDRHGFSSTAATRKFLAWAEEYSPDLLWLHNLHGYYVNVDLLFKWIKSRPQMKVNWTLHDCWSFTGHCTFFTFARCEKWRDHCEHCPQKRTYPASMFFDRSSVNYDSKRSAFTGVRNLTIITPSKWLAELVKQSYLSEYPVEVVHNTVDHDIFRPRESDFREKHGIENRKMILAVSNAWQEPRKGLKDVYKIRELLDAEYAIVVVGLTQELLKTVPEGVIGLAKTSNAQELAGIYSTADVLINPTYEDNYPTVNIEARACGTPVITYRTGGSPESVENENVIEVGDVQAAVMRIKELTAKRRYMQ